MSAERVRAVEACMRPGDAGDIAPVFVRPGARLPVGVRSVELEGGDELPGGAVLHPRVPFGYHQLVMRDGRRVRMVTSPGRCVIPSALAGWGWAAQLYAVRSRAGWGVGDLGDLRALGSWSRRQGASMLLVNPLHGVRPGSPQEASPYFPSSRLYRNPLYLRIQDLPSAREDPTVGELLKGAERLRRAPIIDRDR
ncbi:MAG TPA: 4-alpha-glucanotransferase, partial [Candidatus Dormibacteraeota bacterium]|nr:4-alpha-glucanotransferase [Candidatus Dormibacteraeota bacterium]